MSGLSDALPATRSDGFGGGDEITENLLLNTCRESSDHGPWNSWDRVPYITTLRTGQPSIIPADRRIHHNFVVGNYNSQATIDTDDGSAYYQTYENFLAYASNGMKSDYAGHDNVWTGNLIAYAGTCFGAWLRVAPPPPHPALISLQQR